MDLSAFREARFMVFAIACLLMFAGAYNPLFFAAVFSRNARRHLVGHDRQQVCSLIESVRLDYHRLVFQILRLKASLLP